MSEKQLLASQSMVSRVAKVLNQAERAEEGSPEREAFMAKALQLSQAYAIDLAVARAHQAAKEKREEPERRQFTVGQVGRRLKGKNAHFVDLMLAICDANDIEVVIGGTNVFVYGTGMPSDLNMAERLFAILAVQMVSEADAGLKAGHNGSVRLAPKTQRIEIPEGERAWGQHDGSDNYTQRSYYDEQDEDTKDWGEGPKRHRYHESMFRYEWVNSYPPPKVKNVAVLDDDGQPVVEKKWLADTDARVWRANFYQGFIQRTRVRLRDAKRSALKDAGIDLDDEGDSRALALVDKAEEVRAAFEENEKFVLSTGRTYGGAEVKRYDPRGRDAGDEAGQRARLGNEKDLDHG